MPPPTRLAGAKGIMPLSLFADITYTATTKRAQRPSGLTIVEHTVLCEKGGSPAHFQRRGPFRGLIQ
jgi:hypothetical protein